jgi:hypothetical protein
MKCKIYLSQTAVVSSATGTEAFHKDTYGSVCIIRAAAAEPAALRGGTIDIAGPKDESVLQ